MKRIMLIGAGAADLDVIDKAHEMGLSVVAIDGNNNAPGLSRVEHPVVFDIRDARGVADIASEMRVEGVICAAVDLGVRTVAAVGQRLGLPTLSPEAALNATSKNRMRRIWHQMNVPSPAYRECSCYDHAVAASREIGFPLVVKPSDSAASRGVSYVSDERALEPAYQEAHNFTHSGIVMVEEFMAGVEMSVEGLAYGGRFHAIACSDKIRTEPPHLLDLAVLFPSDRGDRLQNHAKAIVSQAVAALGLDHAPVHAEVMLTSDGPKMVELAARGPGFKVFSRMIPWSSGIDVVREYIRIALGQPPQIEAPQSRGAVLVFPQFTPGEVVRIDGLRQARDIPAVFDAELYVDCGDRIYPLQSGKQRAGHIIALAESRSDAERAARQAEDLLRVEVLQSDHQKNARPRGKT